MRTMIFYYKTTIEKACKTINKHFIHYQTDDLRKYLSDYQEINRCSKSNIDNIRRILSSLFSWLEDENYVLEKDGDNTTYWIDCGETFFNNSGYLKVWNSEAGVWSSVSLLNQIHQTVNIDGWDITPRAATVDGEGHWYVEFK